MNATNYSDKSAGDVETGVASALQRIPSHHVAHVPAPPNWLVRWETSRPQLLSACIAEFIGVFFYVYAGVGASAAFFITSAAGEEGYGSLLTVGVCYGFGIAFGVIVAAPTSGGHLSPCFTLAFWLFKGFPARKVPFYILAQILGAFVATLMVYWQYRQQFVAVHAAMIAGGKAAAVFTPAGPAGILALFPGATQGNGYLFVNEFFVNVVLAILVFSAIDPCTFVVSLSTVPWVLGLGYTVMVCCFAPGSIALNTARDLGGRMACSVVYGSGCFTTYKAYSAIAALTNLPATLIGCFIQVLFLSDTARLLVNLPPTERALHDHVVATRPADPSSGYQGGGLSLRQLTRESFAHKQ